MLHHTLGDGRFDAFQSIYSHITIAQAHIKQPNIKGNRSSDVGEEIDRAIFQALKNNKPTYLTLPTDLVDSEWRWHSHGSRTQRSRDPCGRITD